VAKDLISKLLKTNPAQRIKLEEITEHPFFKNNPPIRPVAGVEP
jgi:serine/threonine protein kinase